MRFENLTHSLDHNGDKVYQKAYLESLMTKVVEFGLDSLYIYEDGLKVSFMLAGFVYEDETGVYQDRVFYGHGYSGSLREMRHTYFGEPGENGYCFYLPGESVILALQELIQYFDLN